MVPDYVEIGALWRVLPPGVHKASMREIEALFVFNETRKRLFNGLRAGVKHLREVGCGLLLLDGSYVTEKTHPNDYDVCWDLCGVDDKKLDPIFLDFKNKRKRQKDKYFGEYFPMLAVAGRGKIFAQFFQEDKDTGKPKGIISIN